MGPLSVHWWGLTSDWTRPDVIVHVCATRGGGAELGVSEATCIGTEVGSWEPVSLRAPS